MLIYNEHGGYVSLDVRDEGIGIPEEDQKHMFDRFFQGKQCG